MGCVEGVLDLDVMDCFGLQKFVVLEICDDGSEFE